VFLLTNIATGTPEKENNVVVVLRHAGIPWAFEDRLWDKYKFGEMFKVKNDKGETVTKNVFWKPAQPFTVPGIGPVPLGINELQDSGVKFVVCNAAMTVYSAVWAMQNNAQAADVLKDWQSGLLPGVTVVPSGVWAVGRAQENKCAYCFALWVKQQNFSKMQTFQSAFFFIGAFTYVSLLTIHVISSSPPG
jgi:intracellular sulfur oxidation DsrE/DsrF family protein